MWFPVDWIRPLEGLAVLCLGQLLGGRAYKEDCCWTLMTAHDVNLKLLYRPKVISFVRTTLQHSLRICRAALPEDASDSLVAPSAPNCLHLSLMPSCFHFSSQEVIYCHTHPNIQTQPRTLILPNRFDPFFLSFCPFFVSFLLLCRWDHFKLSRPIFSSEHLWSVLRSTEVLCSGSAGCLLFHHEWTFLLFFCLFGHIALVGCHQHIDFSFFTVLVAFCADI